MPFRNNLNIPPAVESEPPQIIDDSVALASRAEQPKWFRLPRRGSALLLTSLALTGAVSACGTSPPNPSPPPSPTTPDNPPSIQAGRLWDSAGCLSDYVDIGSNSAFLRPTNLCRSSDTANSTSSVNFYFLFARGSDANAWVEEVGLDTSGNSYWQYPGGLEHELAAGSNQEEVDLNNAFVPVSSLDFLDGIQVGLDSLGEAQAADTVISLEEQTYDPSNLPTPPTADEQQLQQQQQQYQQLEQKNQQLEQQVQAEQSSSGSTGNAAQQEELFLQQQNVNALRIQTAPDCVYSLNGCTI